MKEKKILITGVAGFIGSNLAEAFLDKGYTVVGMDNLSTGKRQNLKQFSANTKFCFVEGDIRDRKLLDEIMPGINVVLHQAALGSVPRSIKDPVTSIDVNITGTTNVLFAAQKHGVERVVYAASSSTYGDSKDLPKIENNIGKPLSPYAISKYVNELLAENFKSIYNLNTIGLRYFNVFGKRQDPESTYAAVIPKFVSQLMRLEAPHINGDGSYSRDFTYIDNVVQANMLAVETTDEHALNRVYNVACGMRTSLNELFEFIKLELSNYNNQILQVKPEYGPVRHGDVPHSLASIQLAKDFLNYKPKFTVQEGLKAAIDWYWNNL